MGPVCLILRNFACVSKLHLPCNANGVGCRNIRNVSVWAMNTDVLALVQAVNHVKIPFNKQTMWRKAIEKGTLDTCREAHTDLVPCQPLLSLLVPLSGLVPTMYCPCSRLLSYHICQHVGFFVKTL